MTLTELAQDHASRFEGATRDDGSHYRRVKQDQQSESLTDLIHTAHGDLLPDDHRYAMIEAALDAIAEDGADAWLEPSIYPHDLTGWLHSRADRYDYCDEAMEEYGQPEGMIQLLTWGMAAEQAEVLASVLDSLNRLVEDLVEAT